ncbi:MAG: hypothetical protein R2716_11410 [Microthrixaceae bacterium]
MTMYTCGITPYDSTHLAHAATYLTYDVLQRRLRDPPETRCVRNITDVDDSILPKARELGVHHLDLAAELARASTPTWSASSCAAAWPGPNRGPPPASPTSALHRHCPGRRLRTRPGSGLLLEVSRFPTSVRPKATAVPRC